MNYQGRIFFLRGADHAEIAAQGGELRVHPGPSEAPWGLARQLLGALVGLRGAAAVEEALRPHRGPLSLVLRGLEADLSPAERREREEARAQVHGYLSHNSVMRRSLLRAWQGALTPLCAGVDLLLPELRGADQLSLVLVTSLMRLQPGLRLFVGWDPEDLPADPIQRWDTRIAYSFGESLRRLEGAARPAGPGRAPLAPADARHPADLPDPIDPSPADALAAMEAAFACFGFTACQRLGLGLLERGGLDGADGRRAHLLTGLSAYNRQVGTRGESAEQDDALAALLHRCFSEALEGEPDPRHRSHLLYRLCINAGRRRSDLEISARYAEDSIREGLGAPMQEAWARNGLAYVLGRWRRTDDAIAECLRAEALLRAPLDGLEELERPLTRVVLADNLIELCALAGRWEEAAAWRERFSADRLEALPPSGRSLKTLRHTQRPAELRAEAERGLRLAEDFLAADEEDWMAAHAADGAYRCGDAGAAVQLYGRALATARQLESADAGVTALGLAMALLRAGRGAEAADQLAQLPAPTAAARAELGATRGWALAIAGAATASEQAINEAISDAVGLGIRDVILRVACAAGEACLALGRVPEAAQAFGQALALGAVGDAPPAADRLWALSGRLGAAGAEEALLGEAVELLPDALAEPEAWWELDRLLDATRALGLPLHPNLATALGRAGR